MEIKKNIKGIQTQCGHRNWGICIWTFIANGQYAKYSNGDSGAKFLSRNNQ